MAHTATPEEGVTIAFKAGMDLICGDYRNGMTTEVGPIINAVRGGGLSEAVVDRALERLFAARIGLGLFDRALPFKEVRTTDFDTPAHRALALEAARKSMVLLKNDGLLPFKDGGPKTIAVIGPNADNVDALIGNYNGTPSAPVTVLAGIRARFPRANILYAPGSSLIGEAELPVADERFCQDADCGLTASLEGEELSVEVPGFTRGDRTSLDLPAPQEALLKRIHATGKPVARCS